MTKLMYVVLGLLVLSGTMLMASVAQHPAGGASGPASADIDIRTLEPSMDFKGLPNGDLDPQVYR